MGSESQRIYSVGAGKSIKNRKVFGGTFAGIRSYSFCEISRGVFEGRWIILIFPLI